MIYSNYDFLLLFPAVAVWFYMARTLRGQNQILLLFSIVFLAWTSGWNLLPIAIVTIATFAYFKIDAVAPSRRGSSVIIVLLVASLTYFKYRSFIAESFGI